MNINQLKSIISICEQSSLDYFRCSMMSEEIVFSKNNCDFFDEADRFRDKDNIDFVVRDDTADFKMRMEEKTEDSSMVIKSSDTGIIHFEEFLKDLSKQPRVMKGELLCTIEAQEQYDGVKTPVTGVITGVLVGDGDMVESGQPLFTIKEITNKEITEDVHK